MHEGDKWRDNDGQAGQQEGGQLVGEGFAAAGGHQYEGITPGEHVLDDFELAGSKCIMAEILFEYGFGVVQRFDGAPPTWIFVDCDDNIMR